MNQNLPDFIIKLKTFANFREIIGSKETTFNMRDSLSIWEFIKYLLKKFPALHDALIADGKIRKNVIIILDDKIQTSDEIKSNVMSSDRTLIILPPAGGEKSK